MLLSSVALLFSCDKGKDNADTNSKSEHDKPIIVSTIFPSYDFAKQISNGKAEVYMLLKPGEETHSYEPTPKDIKLIQSADLFIYTGGENDEWVDNILESMGDDAPDTLKMMDLVNTLDEEALAQDESSSHDHDSEGSEVDKDEHVWTSPLNAIKISKGIADELCRIDPENSTSYKENLANYTKELQDLDNDFHELINNAKRKTIIFADRFPLLYFAKEYGLEYYSAFSGCSANNEVSAKTLAFLIKKVKKCKVPCVFSLEFSSGKIAESISEVCGTKCLTFYSCHNVTAEQMGNGTTYIDMMRENLKSLDYALNGDI